MGRSEPGTYTRSWSSPQYTVNEHGKVEGGYEPAGVNNWGRWGEDDVKGTANLITNEVVKSAASLVHTGETISLALPIDSGAPRFPDRTPPKHYWTMTGADAVVGSPFHSASPGAPIVLDDAIDMPLQGSTQWDGLAHFAVEDSTYNGYWVGNITGLGGADQVGIHHLRDSFVGRGVLLDIAMHKAVDSLEPGEVIGPDLLDEVAAAQGVDIRRGDMLLVRTGYLSRWWHLTTPDEKVAYFSAVPGLGHETIDWLSEKDIAAVAADTVSLEVRPTQDDAQRPGPVHHAALIDLGLTIGELWDLERLSVSCAREKRYEFFLSAAPLNITGAVGSLINPIAVL